MLKYDSKSPKNKVDQLLWPSAVAVRCIMLQWCNVMQCAAVCCSVTAKMRWHHVKGRRCNHMTSHDITWHDMTWHDINYHAHQVFYCLALSCTVLHCLIVSCSFLQCLTVPQVSLCDTHTHTHLPSTKILLSTPSLTMETPAAFRIGNAF